MVIDFSTIGVVEEQPTLVLCNADGTAIQTLGYAFGLKANICYNEASTITFDIPAYVDGEKTPHYDDIIGMRVMDMIGWGRFVLMNPGVKNDGVKEIKSCKAYSLEYELTYKKVFFEEATYNFWNPLSPDNTVLGVIIAEFPSWNIGTVDEDLVNRYRTFSSSDANAYNLMKSTLQQTYSCIFDFDTYTRTINVRSTANEAVSKPVYLSMENLVKEIEIDEDTENIFTVLDVNGGEDVNIRMVNPLGTNKIYNLDYFMNTTHFSQSLIDKWNSWKKTLSTNQLAFYNISVERVLKTTAILTEQTVLSNLENIDLASLESERSVYVEYLAQHTDKSSDDYNGIQDKLTNVNSRIRSKKAEISAQKEVIAVLEQEESDLADELLAIQKSVAFDKFFTADELTIIERYFKEESIEESTFVVSEVDSYSDSDISNNISNFKVGFGSCSYNKATTDGGKTMYTIKGGNLTLSSSATALTAEVVSACFEINDDNTLTLSAFLNSGKIGDTSFPSGCISVTATGATASPSGSSAINLSIENGKIYFTRNTTDYERHSVSWDLFEYGKETLDALAYPSYSFSVSSANFMAIDEFIGFVKQMELGQRIYLNTGSKVIEPLLIGVEIDFEDMTSLSLQFSDKYSASDSASKLVELLNQSISMGKTVDANKLNYSSFVNSGASTKVKEFMDSALDVAKNAIISSSGQGVSWDETGLHLRKYIDSNNPGAGYENEQIWMINNSIVFTDDGWQTAKMAIGKIIDENIARYPETSDTVYDSNKTYYYKDDNGTYQKWTGGETGWADSPLLYEKDATAYGIVAPYIVGTILAGQNLVITTEDGSFRVDSSGVHIDSLKFFITHSNSGYDTTLGEELEGLTNKQNNLSQTIQNVVNENGYLKASELTGVINAQNTQMQSSNGNVLFDSDGLWLLDKPTKAESTKAVWMNETGILFGSGSKGKIDIEQGEDGAWDWTTAIGHDGIVADAIAAGTLSGMNIVGGSLNIGNGALTANDNGDVFVKGTVQAKDFLNSTNGESMLENGKFKSDYLSLYGLTVQDKNNNNLFSVGSEVGASNVQTPFLLLGDYSGGTGAAVYSDGTFKLGTKVTLSWNNIADQPDIPEPIDLSGELESVYGITTTDIGISEIKTPKLSAPIIFGGDVEGMKISGGEYHSLQGNGSLVINDSEHGWVDLILSNNNNEHIFSIYDGIDYASLNLKQNEILKYNIFAESVFSFQNWQFGSEDKRVTVDFSNADVTGLGSNVAVFG